MHFISTKCNNKMSRLAVWSASVLTVEVHCKSAAVAGVVFDFIRSIEVSKTWSISFLLTMRPDRSHHLVLYRVIRHLSSCIATTRQQTVNRPVFCHFTARAAMQASAVLGAVTLSVCLSVRPSIRPTVCLSATRVLCDNTKQYTADILTPYETAITLVFWHQQWLVGDALFRLKFALKVTHPLTNAEFDRFPLITSQQ